MSGSPPNQIHKNIINNSYNDGNSNQYANGFDSYIIKQPNMNYQESFTSPKNDLVALNRHSKVLTRSEINDIDQFGKPKQVEQIKRSITIQQQRRESQLMRSTCVVKDEKTALTFSTLYVSKFIRRIKAVSSRMRFKEMRQSQFKIIDDPSSDFNYYFIKGAFQAEAPSFFDKIYHKFKSKLLIINNLNTIIYFKLFINNRFKYLERSLVKILQSLQI